MEYPRRVYYDERNKKVYERDELVTKEEQVKRGYSYSTEICYYTKEGTKLYNVKHAVIYDTKTLHDMKLPENAMNYGYNLLVLPNDSIREIPNDFTRMDNNLGAIKNNPSATQKEWYGKVTVIKSENDKDFVLYDLENNKELFVMDEKYRDAFTPINKDMCICFYNDYTGWDNFSNSYNESECVLYYKGEIILSSNINITSNFDNDGKLTQVCVNRGVDGLKYYSPEDLENLYQKKTVKKQIEGLVSTLKEMGYDNDQIKEVVDYACKATPTPTKQLDGKDGAEQ